MAAELDLKTMDRRLVDRLVRRGEIAQKDVEKELKQLPDTTDESDTFQVKFEHIED